MTPEAKVSDEIRRALGTRKDCWLRRTAHLKARVVTASGRSAGKAVEAGTRGQADFELHLPGGTVWFLEAKAPTGRLDPDQERFARIVRAFGGVYHVVGNTRIGIGVDELVRRVDIYMAAFPDHRRATIEARTRLGADDAVDR